MRWFDEKKKHWTTTALQWIWLPFQYAAIVYVFPHWIIYYFFLKYFQRPNRANPFRVKYIFIGDMAQHPASLIISFSFWLNFYFILKHLSLL